MVNSSANGSNYIIMNQLQAGHDNVQQLIQSEGDATLQNKDRIVANIVNPPLIPMPTNSAAEE